MITKHPEATVERWHPEKGFGFVRLPDGKTAFCHKTAVWYGGGYGAAELYAAISNLKAGDKLAETWTVKTSRGLQVVRFYFSYTLKAWESYKLERPAEGRWPIFRFYPGIMARKGLAGAIGPEPDRFAELKPLIFYDYSNTPPIEWWILPDDLPADLHNVFLKEGPRGLNKYA